MRLFVVGAFVLFLFAACIGPDPTVVVDPVEVEVQDKVEADTDDEVDPVLESPTPEQWRATNRQSFKTVLNAANRGDLDALAMLLENYREYQIPSIDRADAAEVFGRYRYAPAAKVLAESVDAASMNLGWAAHLSLRQLFPEAAREFPTPEETADYWKEYLTKRGIAKFDE